ncbi:Uncharacterised protein [Vibrio cholerae]|nr:Uncharacterised protein [Vibrio cholerae]
MCSACSGVVSKVSCCSVILVLHISQSCAFGAIYRGKIPLVRKLCFR